MKNITEIKNALSAQETLSTSDMLLVMGGRRRGGRDDKRRQRPGGGTTTTSPSSYTVEISTTFMYSEA